jgi:hypothetical protein
MAPEFAAIITLHSFAVIASLVGFIRAQNIKQRKLRTPFVLVNALNFIVQAVYMATLSTEDPTLWWIAVVLGITQLGAAVRMNAHILELFAFLSPRISKGLIATVVFASYGFVAVGLAIYATLITMEHYHMDTYYAFVTTFIRRPYMVIYGAAASAYDCTQNLFITRKVYEGIKRKTNELVGMKKTIIRLLITNLIVQVTGVGCYLAFVFGKHYYFSQASVLVVAVHSYNLTKLILIAQNLSPKQRATSPVPQPALVLSQTCIPNSQTVMLKKDWP